MEVTPAEIIDRLSIVKLKIERIGEPHLHKELEEYEKALAELREKGITVKQEWIDKLYEINGRIWDVEFVVRQIADKIISGGGGGENISDEQFEEIGKRYLVVGRLMNERVKVKNEIARETGKGFEEVKIDHCAE